MITIFESEIENFFVTLLQKQGWQYLSPEACEAERSNFTEVVLKDRLRAAIENINPQVSADARAQALRQALDFSTQSVIDNNAEFHRMLTEGIRVDVTRAGEIRGERVLLIDFDTPANNDFVVSNQFTVKQDNTYKRPDVVLFVNGLPLVVIELKNPTDEKATIERAVTQLQNYQTAIPTLFNYNAVLVVSDGLHARAGTISSDFAHFVAWKSEDGSEIDETRVPQIATLIKGMLARSVLLDLVQNFIVFEKGRKEDAKTGQSSPFTVKKVAGYHQYFAVNNAIEKTVSATAEGGDGKAGVFWHAQGSGKSLSMVFYTKKVFLRLPNPTVVVITDRNDLDDQLFDTFAACRQLLPQDPAQATSRDNLKELLRVAGGGVIFTTIQKFFPEQGSARFDLLSDRRNIVVIADEAHRSHYGFGAKMTEDKNGDVVTKYGFAAYLRDALPNASFIGFTGTPIEREDISTPAVFGDYVDVYDVERAVKDGATVPIYYESRLVPVHLHPEKMAKLDEQVEEITAGEEKGKAKWAQSEAIIGNKTRLRRVASDIVEHFEKRREILGDNSMREAFEGKGMIVCMSRRIAIELYGEITKFRPTWHSADLDKGTIKVVMTSSSADPEDWQPHSTNKRARKILGERFKDEADELKLVIVCDMWLTGFDVPCLQTMYVDKPMKGHNLMQAIARVNRVFKTKQGGLIADYVGIATNLKDALADYTAGGGKGKPTFNQQEAVDLMIEKYEIVAQMFNGFDYKRYFKAEIYDKLKIILGAVEHVLHREVGKDEYIKNVSLLSQAFALSVPHREALAIRDEVGFFQAVKAQLTKFEAATGSGKSSAEIELEIKQIVDGAVVADGIVDVFDAAGIKNPDISILSDDFLAEIKAMERKNTALEVLKKLLKDEVWTRRRKNLTQSRKLSEMLEEAIRKYQNNLLTAAQVIEELVELAKMLRDWDKEGAKLNLSEEETAFYTALANNDSAKEVLGDKKLTIIAVEVFRSVKRNATIDWTLKESVRAKLRVGVRRILNKYGYPPDEQLAATENVLAQAELMADELRS